MKVLCIQAKNFQSYKIIQFDNREQGLCLISGPTGAGKSTLMDLMSWILYGITSKGGAADDVLSWGTEEMTEASAAIDLPVGTIVVFRIRGKSSQNDLYWLESGLGEPIRGKDLTDTQRLLEVRLGVSAELFLLGSYMTQFSKADSFFIAKAKDRREVLEKIADQEFAVTLGEKVSESRKSAKKSLSEVELQLSKISGRMDGLMASHKDAQQGAAAWNLSKTDKISKLKDNFNSFDSKKEQELRQLINMSTSWELALKRTRNELSSKLKELPVITPEEVYKDAIAATRREQAALKKTECPTCGAPSGGEERALLQEEISKLTQAMAENSSVIEKKEYFTSQLTNPRVNPYVEKLGFIRDQCNPYAEQISATIAELNPFNALISRIIREIDELRETQVEWNNHCTQLTSKISRLDWLYDKSFELRGILMQRAVTQIQSNTNSYLERFFDAALRINLTIEGSDKIEAEIYNEGHSASFKSLSGGERCMLKLAFSLSLMRAAQDKAGVSFGTLMLDEPFNGLDSELKTKAFALLRELSTEYDSVLVIEHDESVKSLFDKTFYVEKSGGYSTITG